MALKENWVDSPPSEQKDQTEGVPAFQFPLGYFCKVSYYAPELPGKLKGLLWMPLKSCRHPNNFILPASICARNTEQSFPVAFELSLLWKTLTIDEVKKATWLASHYLKTVMRKDCLTEPVGNMSRYRQHFGLFACWSVTKKGGGWVKTLLSLYE